MNASRWRLRGLTEAEWFAHTDPLRMPKVFHRPPHRKCAFLACAYALSSPGGLRHPFARRVAETLQRTITASPFPANLSVALRGALAREYPGDMFLGNSGYYLSTERARDVGADRYHLDGFLSALTGSKLPSRGAVNAVAASCLSRVRREAYTEAGQKLDALRQEFVWQYRLPAPVPATPPPPRSGWRGIIDLLFPPTVPPVLERPPAPAPLVSVGQRPGLREAVLALFPEVEREKLAAELWTEDQIPVAIRNRYSMLVAEAAASAVGAEMADLVREVFGNPFRPPEIDPGWRACNNGAVRHIAEQIAATANFADLPILADALEDAGCTDEALLRHCREEHKHVPGCWALDAVLGH